jgi:predicted enzyme related to lactoylglutathione lyase
VADDELMTIGQFANLSGLSVHALRHYDDVGLLAPAQIDPASGYRRYRRDQLGRARLIRALRWTDLPIEEIRHVIDDEDYSSFMFGEYGQDGFFLLVLVDDADRLDRPGPSTFGLLVDDLATTHARALAAGGTELVAPRDAQGLPRNSAVKDPSGNWIWLYQG